MFILVREGFPRYLKDLPLEIGDDFMRFDAGQVEDDEFLDTGGDSVVLANEIRVGPFEGIQDLGWETQLR